MSNINFNGVFVEDNIPSEENFYNDLKSSPNNFSYWFPKIKGCGILMPESIIIQVPKDIVISLFLERNGDKERVKYFIETQVMPLIPSSWGEKVFLKNGCFSDKFTFSNCSPRINVDSILDSILNINMESFCLDTGGCTEIIVRRFIGGNDDWTDTIYDGMRLRPEFRVFYDFDHKKVLYSANYWDWDYCHDRISYNPHDGEVYSRAYPNILSEYELNREKVENIISTGMRNVELSGIWSIDIMSADGKFWLIDMAIGYRSAYWNTELVKSKLNEQG